MSTTLQEVQQQVDDWIKSTGKGYFNILTNAGILAEETGEVCRLLVRMHGDQSFKLDDPLRADVTAQQTALADEMADLLWVLCALANQNNINLDIALAQNIKKKTARDSERHQSNHKLT